MGIVEAEAVQGLNTRSVKEKTYHLLISFRPEDEAKLAPEAFREIETRFAQTLGFSEHQRHCGVHKNEAGQGSEIALAVLRSKGESVEPEQEAAQPKIKDWSQHGREQFLTGKADHAVKERASLEREDLSAKAKKPLQAFLRMERIVEASKAQGYDLGDIARHVDGKGVVIFTLASGGSGIRGKSFSIPCMTKRRIALPLLMPR
jgi:hypothetical protein